MRDDRRMHDLIAELGNDDTDLAELAEAELRDDYGPLIVDPLLEAMPDFGNFGILCAVELLEEFGDERAGPTLISLLENEEHVVREWAARALGTLGIRDAIDPLKLVYDRVKARRTPLDWTEPGAIWDALTRLGGREEVLPASAERLTAKRADPGSLLGAGGRR
jgi:HEAT repeat protein